MMKKSFFFAGLAAALCLVGCNKETDVKGLDGRPVEIVLSDVATRTVNDGMSTAWAEDDALTVFYAPSGTAGWSANTKFTVTDAASNTATGEVALTAGSYDWYLFYPYTSQIPNPTGKNDDGKWTGYFYVGSSAGGSQTQKGLNSSAHIAGNRVPVVGRATGVPADQTPAVPMKHLSTLLKINVTNVYEKPVTITKVSFTAPVDIVGSAYMDFSGAEPVLVPSEGHVGKTAQLTVSNAEPLATGSTASFYLAVMPFSIASGNLLTVDIVAEEGTFKAELEVSKAYTFEAGKVKNLNVDFEMETPIEAMTVTEALAAEDESSVTIAGAVVAALSTKGFIITDGTSNVYVYLGAAPEVTIGNEVTLSATFDADYYGLPEIKSVSSCKVTSSGNTVPYTTLVELDKDNIDGYDCTVAADYIAVTGTLEKSSSGSYYNVRPEGSTRYARTDYLVSSIDPSGYVGKTVTMKGYFNTLHSKDNYLKVVATEFISDDTPAPALANIAVSGQKTGFTVGDTFSFGGTVTATYADDSTKDVTASATFSGYDMSTAGNQTVTVSYTEGGITKTTSYGITVSAPVTGGTTVSMTMTEYVTEHVCTVSSGNNATMYKTLKLSDAVRMSTTGEDNCGSFWGSTTHDWRLYQNKNGNVIVSVAEGCELVSVTLTFSSNNSGALFDGSMQVKSGEKQTLSGSSVTYTVGNTGEGTSGQVRVTAVEVVYTGNGKFPDDPEQPTVITTSITMQGNCTVYVGETFELNATSNVEGAPITYESEDPSIATVSAAGVVTGVAEGAVKVYARIAAVEGQYTAADRYCNVTVSKKPEEVGGTWEATTLSAIADGAEFVLVSTKENASYAMSNDNGTSSAPKAVSVTVSGNTISNPASNLVFVLKKVDGGYVFQIKDKDTAVYCFNNNNGLRVGTNEHNVFSLDLESGYLVINDGTQNRYIGVYNNADWRSYTSVHNNIKDQTFTFYVKK